MKNNDRKGSSKKFDRRDFNKQGKKQDCAHNRPDNRKEYGKYGSKPMDNRESLDSVVSNEIKWYNRSPLYTLATRVPWNQIMGTNTEFQSTEYTQYAPSIPGVLTIDFIPTIGWAVDMNSAVNRAYNQLFSDIAARTNGALQLQQMDLAIMTVGVSSIACHLGYAKKVLQSYQAYASLNYYLPKPVIAAMGIDFEDLVEHAADYQIYLTDLINRFNRLAIPNFSDVHVRQYALAHNLYSDSETVFGQLTNFRPIMIYRFDDTDHSLRGHFIWGQTQTQWETITMGAYLDEIRTALQRWENSSVTPIVAGNVRRAYPASSLVQIDQYDPNARFTAHVDRNIAWQVNNMRWNTMVPNSLDITQDPVANILICKPKWRFNTANNCKLASLNYVNLNSFDGNTSPEFAMEATRLIPLVQFNFNSIEPDESGHYDVELVNCPSELVARVTVFTRMTQPDGSTLINPMAFNTCTQVIENDVITTEAPALTTLINALNKWRNGPYVLVHYYDADNEEPMTNEPIDNREIAIYTHLHQDQLDMLHLAASQSLFWAQGMPLNI